MALETVLFPVEFSQGVDTKTDPKRVVPGKLLILENGMFTKSKKIIKRPGYDSLSTTVIGDAPILSSDGISILNSELLQYSLNTLYSYSQTLDQWIKKAPLYSIKNTNKSIVRTTHVQSTPDLAVNGTIAVYAYEDSGSGGINVTVLETQTGTVFQNNVVLSSTGVMPQLLSLSNSIYLFYAEGTNLKLVLINPSVPTELGAPITLFTDLRVNQPFDVTPRNDVILLAYNTSVGTNQIKVAYITTDGNVGGLSTGWPNVLTLPHPVTTCLSLVVNLQSFSICVFYANNTDGLCYTGLNQDFTTLQPQIVLSNDTINVPVRISPYIISSIQAGIFYEKSNGSGPHYVRQRTLAIVGGGGTNVDLVRGVGLASRAFQVNGETFVNVVFPSDLQATYFCVREDGTLVSKMLPLQASGLPARNVLPSVRVSASQKVSFAALIKTQFISEQNRTYSLVGLSVEIMDFGNSDPYISKFINDTLIISGGIVSSYDGFYPNELGFHIFPEGITYTTSTISGGGGGTPGIATGTYGYYVTYEWVDRTGAIHKSQPSPLIQVTTGPGTTNSVTLTIPTLRLTEKRIENGVSPVMIRVYRTESNLTTARKLDRIVYNDPTVDTIDFFDDQTSSASGQLLYSDGGVLFNHAPPSASLVDVSKNRVILSGLENPYQFTYSKVVFQQSGVAFNLAFNTDIDPLGGEITALKFMDDKIILFKNSHIFYIVGDGPDDTGNANDFSKPILITSDSGCVDPKSCVLTPVGVMYKSKKGIYLLDRSLSTQYIGADVEAYNSYKVKDVATTSDQSQVRFVLSESYELMYDYYASQWSVYTNHGGVGSAEWTFGGVSRYIYAKDNGKIYVQNSTSYLDNGSSYSLRIGTSWLKVNGLQGFQRVRNAFILGDYESRHKLRVAISYDYEPYVSQTVIFNADEVLDANHFGDGVFGSESIFGGSQTSVEQFMISFNRQKCQSIKLTFDDLENESDAEGYSLSDLTLEVGLKRGPMRLPSSKRIG